MPKTVAQSPHHHHKHHHSSKAKKRPSEQYCGWLWTLSATISLLASAAYLYVRAGQPLTSPHPAPILTNSLPELLDRLPLLWGSYRPHVYFGLKSRTAPESLLFGMLWRGPRFEMRHFCDQNDKLPSYGWNQHDGLNFGQQLIKDHHLHLNTSFVKHSAVSWSARVDVFTAPQPLSAPATDPNVPPPPPPATETVLYFYLHNEGMETMTSRAVGNDGFNVLGETAFLGKYSFGIRVDHGDDLQARHRLQMTQMTIRPVDMSNTVLILDRNTRQAEAHQHDPNAHPPNFKPQDPRWNQRQSSATTFVVQLQTQLPVTVDFTFGPTEDALLLFTKHDDQLEHHSQAFLHKFESTYRLQAKNVSKPQQRMAQLALSNLIGGMGYWYGQSIVRDVAITRDYEEKLRRNPPLPNQPPPAPPKDTFPYFNAPLFSAVPSRSFFPRGFIWDEGFHQLLIRSFQPRLTRESMAHWLDLMNRYGWIPREQILGAEARSKVPEQFVVQPSDNANPPTWFLVFEDMLDDIEASQGEEDDRRHDAEFLKAAYPRLLAWYMWYESQRGAVPGSYHWRGRTLKPDELNPLTLTSGLDDYPRASVPSDVERHVDLRCWMAVAARVLARIAKLNNEPSAAHFDTVARDLYSNAALNSLHWSDAHRGYFDYGLHQLGPNQKPRERFVSDVYGYVTLYPLMLKILDANSPQLAILLEDLDNTTLLWTPYGLRSVATTSRYYLAYNKEHEAPYWRGPIWINLNYLTVRALEHYAALPGPNQDRAADLAQRLRSNIVSNIFKVFKSTGYIWEQYDDRTGSGKGCFPFTGWSALVVALLAF